MKAILVAGVLAACAFAFAIGVARADDGSAARPASPVTQPVQQGNDGPRHDCPEEEGSGDNGSQGSSEQQF